MTDYDLKFRPHHSLLKSVFPKLMLSYGATLSMVEPLHIPK